jgi:hypothetical protein
MTRSRCHPTSRQIPLLKQHQQRLRRLLAPTLEAVRPSTSSFVNTLSSNSIRPPTKRSFWSNHISSATPAAIGPSATPSSTPGSVRSSNKNVRPFYTDSLLDLDFSDARFYTLKMLIAHLAIYTWTDDQFILLRQVLQCTSRPSQIGSGSSPQLIQDRLPSCYLLESCRAIHPSFMAWY